MYPEKNAKYAGQDRARKIAGRADGGSLEDDTGSAHGPWRARESSVGKTINDTLVRGAQNVARGINKASMAGLIKHNEGALSVQRNADMSEAEDVSNAVPRKSGGRTRRKADGGAASDDDDGPVAKSRAAAVATMRDLATDTALNNRRTPWAKPSTRQGVEALEISDRVPRRRADGGDVEASPPNLMTTEEKRNYGTGILRERMTRKPDTDERMVADRPPGDRPTVKEQMRREGDIERATARSLRFHTDNMVPKGDDYERGMARRVSNPRGQKI